MELEGLNARWYLVVKPDTPGFGSMQLWRESGSEGGGVLWVCCSGALGCSAKEAEDQVEGIQLINAPLFVVTLRTTVCVQRQSTQGADQRYG